MQVQECFYSSQTCHDKGMGRSTYSVCKRCIDYHLVGNYLGPEGTMLNVFEGHGQKPS